MGPYTVRGYLQPRPGLPITVFGPHAAAAVRRAAALPGARPADLPGVRPALPLREADPRPPPLLRPPAAVLSECAAATRVTQDSEARARCVDLLAEIALSYLRHSVVVRRIVAEEGTLCGSSPSLLAMTTVKSTGTLLKRSSSIRMYRAWFVTAGATDIEFFSEPLAYRYFKFLHDDRAPATRAASMRQAFHFLGGLFALPLEVFVGSSRLHGLSVMSLRTRTEVRQSLPLKVRMVMALEALVLKDDGAGAPNALAAGVSLFALFARARIGDLARCTVEPCLDIAADGSSGYVETRFMQHKTSRPGSRRALPITANAFGLRRAPWADAWLRGRAAAGLEAGAQGTLLPAAARAGWHSVPLKTTEFASQLRALLLEMGFAAEELVGIGAHSLKVTCLSWAAKHGVDREERRMLGYHVKPGDRTLESYSRDSMATPLRSLDKVLAAISDSTFIPDATRSGTFSCSSAAAPAPAPPPAPSSPSSSSSTLSSASSACSVVEFIDAVQEQNELSIILNEATGKHHIDDGEGRTRCSKPYPLKLERLSSVPPGGKLCSRCF